MSSYREFAFVANRHSVSLPKLHFVHPNRAARDLQPRVTLLVEGMNDLHPAQLPFVQKRNAVANWRLEEDGRIGLFDVVTNATPTVLIGVTGHPGTFSEKAVRESESVTASKALELKTKLAGLRTPLQ